MVEFALSDEASGGMLVLNKETPHVHTFTFILPTTVGVRYLSDVDDAT